jgi:hypothetical protein
MKSTRIDIRRRYKDRSVISREQEARCVAQMVSQ